MRPAAPKLPSLPLSHPPDSHFGAPRCAQTAFPQTPGSASVRPAAPKWLFLSLRTHFGAPRCAETAFSAVRRDSRFLCFFGLPEGHVDAPRCAQTAFLATQKPTSLRPAAPTLLCVPPRSPFRCAPLRSLTFSCHPQVHFDSPRCAQTAFPLAPPLRPRPLSVVIPVGFSFLAHPDFHLDAPRCAQMASPGTQKPTSVRPAAPELFSLQPRNQLRCAPLRPNCLP